MLLFYKVGIKAMTVAIGAMAAATVSVLLKGDVGVVVISDHYGALLGGAISAIITIDVSDFYHLAFKE